MRHPACARDVMSADVGPGQVLRAARRARRLAAGRAVAPDRCFRQVYTSHIHLVGEIRKTFVYVKDNGRKEGRRENNTRLSPFPFIIICVYIIYYCSYLLVNTIIIFDLYILGNISSILVLHKVIDVSKN